jgi:hypothetical protein
MWTRRTIGWCVAAGPLRIPSINPLRSAGWRAEAARYLAAADGGGASTGGLRAGARAWLRRRRLRGDGTGRSAPLPSHLDVVPAPPERWTHDPRWRRADGYVLPRRGGHEGPRRDGAGGCPPAGRGGPRRRPRPRHDPVLASDATSSSHPRRTRKRWVRRRLAGRQPSETQGRGRDQRGRRRGCPRRRDPALSDPLPRRAMRSTGSRFTEWPARLDAPTRQRGGARRRRDRTAVDACRCVTPTMRAFSRRRPRRAATSPARHAPSPAAIHERGSPPRRSAAPRMPGPRSAGARHHLAQCARGRQVQRHSGRGGARARPAPARHD